MFNVVGFLRSLVRRLFALRSVESTTAKSTTRSEIAAATVMTSTTGGNEKVNSGFDMRSEIAKLAERIVEPVATKLSAQELEPVVGRIRDTFEDLNKRAPADADFQDMAVNIVEPIRSMLSEAELGRIVDRLSGALAAFCQKVIGGQRAA
jgi:hypothetical protein